MTNLVSNNFQAGFFQKWCRMDTTDKDIDKIKQQLFSVNRELKKHHQKLRSRVYEVVQRHKMQ